jgi:hypothetical protein
MTLLSNFNHLHAPNERVLFQDISETPEVGCNNQGNSDDHSKTTKEELPKV